MHLVSFLFILQFCIATPVFTWNKELHVLSETLPMSSYRLKLLCMSLRFRTDTRAYKFSLSPMLNINVRICNYHYGCFI